MAGEALTEVVKVSNDKKVAETGGAHNQKGTEFQKNWAIVKMLGFEGKNEPDFLFLFEAIQDVAILDSSDSPTKIDLYQIKKKDRGEWTWSSLTDLHEPDDPAKPRKRKEKPLTDIKGSPVGKLHAAVRAFSSIGSSGCFVSNAGCNVSMDDGSNAATSLPVTLASLPSHFQALLINALTTLHEPNDPGPDLSKLILEKVDLPVDNPTIYTIGKAHIFLNDRSPKHAGQAQSLVEGLLMKLSPLGAQTVVCKTFEDIKQRHGFTRAEFVAALASLEEILDVDHFLSLWLGQLQREGMGFMEVTSIRTSVAAIYRRQVMGSQMTEEKEIKEACDVWLSERGDPTDLLPFFTDALAHLTPQFPHSKKSELQAHFALRAIAKCVDQN